MGTVEARTHTIIMMCLNMCAYPVRMHMHVFTLAWLVESMGALLQLAVCVNIYACQDGVDGHLFT